MKITLFAKKRSDNSGKVFYTYIGKLTRKSTGEVITVSVKFRAECGAPDPHKCPRIIEFDARNANYTERTIERDDGSSVISRTLWITEWKDAGEYIDTSMDDFA